MDTSSEQNETVHAGTGEWLVVVPPNNVFQLTGGIGAFLVARSR